MPQNDAGMRIEPPWSPPIAISISPAAISAAEPDDEPPGRIAHAPGIVHGTRRIGVAAARETEKLAMRLADDRAAGIENARDDGCIDVGRIAFKRRCAVHHRYAGKTDIVLQRDALAFERARGGAAHLAFHIPGIERVFVRTGLIARRARILHLRQIVGKGVDAIIGLEGRFHLAQKSRKIGIAHGHVEIADDPAQLIQGRAANGHVDLPHRGHVAPRVDGLLG